MNEKRFYIADLLFALAGKKTAPTRENSSSARRYLYFQIR